MSAHFPFLCTPGGKYQIDVLIGFLVNTLTDILINITRLFIRTRKKRKTESLKKAQHDKIENVAGSVWLSLFMDGTVKWKLPSTPPSTGLSRIQHLTRNGTILEFWNIRRCVHMSVIMEPSMWHVSAIPWKAAYGPQVQK
jgi:hypothetical protein